MEGTAPRRIEGSAAGGHLFSAPDIFSGQPSGTVMKEVISDPVRTDQPAEAYRLLRLFSEKSCARREELGADAAEKLLELELVYPGLSGELCVRSMVRLAMNAIKWGCDPRRVSAYLSWRDFEAFVAEALAEAGYEVFRNLRFGVRRREFDVLAVSVPSSLGVAVDCKHWSPRHSSGRIREVSLAHMGKVREFLDHCGYVVIDYPVLRRVRELLGVVVTLSESLRGSVGGVGVVPIYYFGDFVRNLRYYAEELKLSVLKNPCYIG